MDGMGGQESFAPAGTEFSTYRGTVFCNYRYRILYASVPTEVQYSVPLGTEFCTLNTTTLSSTLRYRKNYLQYFLVQNVHEPKIWERQCNNVPCPRAY